MCAWSLRNAAPTEQLTNKVGRAVIGVGCGAGDGGERGVYTVRQYKESDECIKYVLSSLFVILSTYFKKIRY